MGVVGEVGGGGVGGGGGRASPVILEGCGQMKDHMIVYVPFILLA